MVTVTATLTVTASVTLTVTAAAAVTKKIVSLRVKFTKIIKKTWSNSLKVYHMILCLGLRSMPGKRMCPACHTYKEES